MRQRGRKSSASLSIVPVTAEGRRPIAPAHLDALATKLWDAIIADSPEGWITVAQEPLLAAFCSHASTAEFISKLIEEDRPEDLPGDRDRLRGYSRLLGMRVRETAAMSALATKMRLTQQAQIQPRSAGRAWDASTSGPKLWDPKPWDDC